MTQQAKQLPPSPAQARLNHWHWLALVASLFISLVWQLGGYELFDHDEGAFSEATRAMFERGDFLMTYLHGNPRFDKPIFIYWLQAASTALWGFNEWAFRLPSALAASAWVLVILNFGRRHLSRPDALAAALLCCHCLTFSIIGRAATADALLNLCIASSLLGIYDYWQRPDRKTLLLVYAAMGIGVLTKGPVAIVIPALVSALFYARQGQIGPWLKAVLHPLGWALLLVLVVPWYAYVLYDQGQAFIDGFILKHNVNRFSNTMEGHGGYWFYYLLMTFVVLLPFSALFVCALRGLFKRSENQQTQPLKLFLWCWFGVVLVIFSFSNTQLPHYILYGCTPLFILMALERQAIRQRFWLFLPLLLLALLLLLLPELLIYQTQNSSNAYEQAMLAQSPGIFRWPYRLAAAGVLLMGLLLLLVKRLPAWPALLSANALMLVFIYSQLLPNLAALQQTPVREAALLAKTLDEPVVAYRINKPSFSVYAGRITPKRKPRAGEIFYSRVDRIEALGAFEILYQKGGILLGRMPALTADRDGPAARVPDQGFSESTTSQ